MWATIHASPTADADGRVSDRRARSLVSALACVRLIGPASCLHGATLPRSWRNSVGS